MDGGIGMPVRLEMEGNIWLNTSISTDKLQESTMGYIHRARSELMNVIDCVIQKTDDHSMKNKE
jgi:hypothetical protein